MHGLRRSHHSNYLGSTSDVSYFFLRFKLWANTLYEKVTRPYLQPKFSRFEWNCVDCLTHHWIDVPTLHLQLYLKVFQFYDLPRCTLGPSHYLIQEKDTESSLYSDVEGIPLSEGERRPSSSTVLHHPLSAQGDHETASQYSVKEESVHRSSLSTDPQHLHVLVNPDGEGHLFRILSIDLADHDLSKTDIGDLLKKKYQEELCWWWRKFLYGEPIGVGCFEFQQAHGSDYASISRGPMLDEHRARLSSHTFGDIWKLKGFLTNNEIKALLPLEDHLEAGRWFRGLFLVHYPSVQLRWFRFWLLILFVPVAIVWNYHDDTELKLLAFYACVLGYINNFAWGTWKSAKKWTENFIAIVTRDLS